MKVLLTGGGTGGHITPLLAVAQKLKQLNPDIQIIYVGERKSKFASMTEDQADFDEQYTIFAGKFRRYNGESWLKQLLDVGTVLSNLRDVFYVIIGVVQSYFLLRRLRPDVILMKGGYVGVPIGLAAGKRYPLVTHDSDALPGLANRIVSKRATYHATAMPAASYSYPAAKTRQVGVIVEEAFCLVTPELQMSYREVLKIPPKASLITITGGSLGSRNLNQAIASFVPDLLAKDPNLWVVHQVGRGHLGCYNGFEHPRLQISELLSPLATYLGAADLVVTRAGANTLAELGVQAKAAIVVPNPLLTGGHQLKNAQYLADKQAIVMVNEANLNLSAQEGRGLAAQVNNLLSSPKLRQQLANNLHKQTMQGSSERLAKLILKAAQQGSRAK